MGLDVQRFSVSGGRRRLVNKKFRSSAALCLCPCLEGLLPHFRCFLFANPTHQLLDGSTRWLADPNCIFTFFKLQCATTQLQHCFIVAF